MNTLYLIKYSNTSINCDFSLNTSLFVGRILLLSEPGCPRNGICVNFLVFFDISLKKFSKFTHFYSERSWLTRMIEITTIICYRHCSYVCFNQYDFRSNSLSVVFMFILWAHLPQIIPTSFTIGSHCPRSKIFFSPESLKEKVQEKLWTSLRQKVLQNETR